MKKINNLKATKTVFCYYYPETRKVIDGLTKKFPHEVFLQSITPGLDDFHVPIFKKFLNFHKASIPALKNFKYQYFTNGASEGIFHLLTKLKTENSQTIIYVLKGEYEGFKAYGQGIGLKIVEVEQNCDFDKLESGVFFISNPSARDGNIISNSFMEKLYVKHRVVYDVTYVGLTKSHEFDLSNEKIIAVVASMSKPFGLYYYRVGFTFTRTDTPTLMGNKWFKSIFSLMIADKILDNFKINDLYEKYRKLQLEIIEKLNTQNNLNLKPSDVLLLANSDEPIDGFMRDKFCRLCLSPYFLEEEKQ